MQLEENGRVQSILVSVVIPTFKRPEMVRRAVHSVLEQDLDPGRYEVIVVDSSPDDQNVATVADLRLGARCALRCLVKKPEGPGPSRRLGAQEAHGEFVAFMDSDCQATRGWLREGVAAFEPEVGLVQGQTQPDPAAARGVLSWYALVDKEGFIYESCNIFYRRWILAGVGGFPCDLTPNAETPTGGEDVELAWKVKRMGWKSRFAEKALVYHEVVPVSLWRWLFSKRLYIWPRITKRVPEVRRFLYARYFYDRAQACFVAVVVGLALAWFKPIALVCCVPYVVLRASERTATLKGPLRPLRVLAYAAKDGLAFTLLVAGSFRYRSLLL